MDLAPPPDLAPKALPISLQIIGKQLSRLQIVDVPLLLPCYFLEGRFGREGSEGRFGTSIVYIAKRTPKCHGCPSPPPSQSPYPSPPILAQLSRSVTIRFRTGRPGAWSAVSVQKYPSLSN